MFLARQNFGQDKWYYMATVDQKMVIQVHSVAAGVTAVVPHDIC